MSNLVTGPRTVLALQQVLSILLEKDALELSIMARLGSSKFDKKIMLLSEDM